MASAAVSHGLPAGSFSVKGQSYTQVYAGNILRLTDGVEPLLIDIERVIGLMLEQGKKLKFNRIAARLADPYTAAKIAEVLGKSAYISTDEGRDMTGFAPKGEDWSDEIYADGNRRPLSSLADIAEAQITKNKPTGRPGEGGEMEYPEVPSPEKP